MRVILNSDSSQGDLNDESEVLEWLITERTGADDTVRMWLKTEKDTTYSRSAGNPVAYCIIEKT